MQSLVPTTQPELTRTDLTTPILQLKSLGIDDLMKFEWVTSPPAESVLRALETLVAAGMVGEDGRLTVVGEKVAECPVEVNIARMVCDYSETPRSALIVREAICFERLQVWRRDPDHRRNDNRPGRETIPAVILWYLMPYPGCIHYP